MSPSFDGNRNLRIIKFNMSEKNFSFSPEREREQKIVIKRSIDAPPEVKENPFYDSEFWGRADSPEDIYLPDSDEAISFAIAAHEIGHLVEEGKRSDAGLDNFEATRAEEQRAWDNGWEYLQKYLGEYYQDRSEIVPKIHQVFEKIRNFLMQGVDLSKGMYLEQRALNNLNAEEIEDIMREKRKVFFLEKGQEFKRLFDEVKGEKIGVKPDWEKFITIVEKAVRDIISNNKKVKLIKK